MPLTSEQRVHYEEHGFVCFQQQFDAEEIASLRKAFTKMETQAIDLHQTADIIGPSGEGPESAARFVLEPTGENGALALQRVIWCGGLYPELLIPSVDARTLGLALELLRVSEVDQLVHQAHFKQPKDGVRFTIHQDAWNRRVGTALWRGSEDDGDFLQVLLTIDPMGPENGGLYVVPGSHRLGPLLGPDRQAVARRHAPNRVHLHLPPGSLVAFGPFLLHGSDENLSTRPRRVLISGFARRQVNHRIYPGAGKGVRRRLHRMSS